MVFSWLKKRRRKAILEAPFPDAWRALLERDVSLWASLRQEERARLEDDLRLFMAEKDWEACGGLELTAEMKAVISAQACLLVLGLSLEALAHVRAILVYPESYWAPSEEVDESGVVTEEEEDREGEAWERGIVVLSWKELLYDSRRSWEGRNLVLHEFAHQLDPMDRVAIVGKAELASIRETLEAEFEDFSSRKRRLRGEVLDRYASGDEAEFFAVATESFFGQAESLKKVRPSLYGALRAYYGQDPASRPPPRPSGQ